MSEQGGTTLDAEQRTTPDATQPTTPEGREPVDAQPSTPAAEPSPETVGKDKYEAALREMHERQREAAEARAENERLRQMTEIALGRVQQQEDPEAAAYKAWQEGYYTADAPELHKRYLEARDQKRFASFGDNLMRQFELRQKIPQAAQMLGINDQGALAAQLKSVHSTLTPDELALVQLSRQNKLDDWVSRSKQQREAEARRATALDQFGSIRGAPRIPGDSPDLDAKLIPFEEWAAASSEAKQRLRTAKEKFVIVGAPKHFDPNKD